jgi:hypothetical protein
MPEVQRSRFTTWLKNLTGFRGRLSLNLDSGISPTYDFSSIRPELDDEVAFWYSMTTVAAVAANFSQLQVIMAGSGRTVIDGLLIRAQALVAVLQFGITGLIAAPTNSAMSLASNFLGNRGPVFAVAAQQLGAVLNSRANNSAVSLFSGGGSSMLIDTSANGPTIVLGRDQLPGNVVTPGFAFTVESQALNQRIDVGWWGRYYGDQT